MNCIPLNCSIDELMGGGIRARTITQVYGPPGSGKTNIALQASINAVKMGKRAVFIDPESGFSEKRLEQMVGKDKEKILSSIILFEPGSFGEQGKIISSLWELDDIGLVVVDSIVYHYRLEMDQENPRPLSQELGRQVGELLNLARKKDLAVLITNQVYTNMDNGHVEPVGGDTLKYGSKVIVEITKEPRKAKLIKHKFLKSGKEVEFKIVGKGVI
ncbi:MAG: DNA repair and recombination protein RadB [Candidatus Diapherotrites archaeon]|nr:DNA repair and recombination protein RadB [Candidatus Diapherotrites archaeon]